MKRASFILLTLALVISSAAPGVPAADAPFWTDAVGRGEDVDIGRVNRTLVKLAQTLKPAVVQIGISAPARDEGEAPPADRLRVGSGFIIHPSGFILTNNHVIEHATAVEVHLLDQRKFPAKVVGKDSRTDLALLKVEAPGDLPAIPLGDSDALEVGELVLAVGNPFGLGHTVTMGIVSRKGPGLRAGPFEDYIQTDASINPGNSGGPLVNGRGEAVGIVTAVIPNRQVGFAIPIGFAKGLLPELRARGKIAWGFLGVGIQNLTDDVAKGLGVTDTKGALVNNILPGMPAGAAGVKRGDVIVGFDGKEIPDVRTLQRIVSRAPVGKQAELRVLRGGAMETLTVTVAEAGGGARAAGGSPVPARDLGLKVEELDEEMAKKFKLSKEEEGVVITEVAKGSPAATAGVRVGDVVREVNRKAVASVDGYRRSLRGDAPDVPDVLLIKRGENFFYVAMKPKT